MWTDFSLAGLMYFTDKAQWHSAAESLAARDTRALCVGVPICKNLLRHTIALLYFLPRGVGKSINKTQSSDNDTHFSQY